MNEDLNIIYGLSFVGIDPAMLTNKLITNIDWLSVYKVRRKVKIKHVHVKHYKKYMMLHQKGHQNVLMNNELLVALVSAFSYENCTSTKEVINKEN